MVNDTETGDRTDDGPPDPKHRLLKMLQQAVQADNSSPGKEMLGLPNMNVIAHIMCAKDYEIYCLRMAVAHAKTIIDMRRESINVN